MLKIEKKSVPISEFNGIFPNPHCIRPSRFVVIRPAKKQT